MANTSSRRGIGLLIARASFLANGKVIQKGTVVDAKDPIVKGRENLFERAEDRLRDTRREP